MGAADLARNQPPHLAATSLELSRFCPDSHRQTGSIGSPRQSPRTTLPCRAMCELEHAGQLVLDLPLTKLTKGEFVTRDQTEKGCSSAV
jgi:hypothetical protein